MKKILLVTAICLATAETYSQRLAQPIKEYDKYIFVESNPVDKYEIVDSVWITSSQYQKSKEYYHKRDKLIKKAILINKQFDAIMIDLYNDTKGKAYLIKFLPISEK